MGKEKNFDVDWPNWGNVPENGHFAAADATTGKVRRSYRQPDRGVHQRRALGCKGLADSVVALDAPVCLEARWLGKGRRGSRGVMWKADTKSTPVTVLPEREAQRP
jgi:hypothetical protein